MCRNVCQSNMQQAEEVKCKMFQLKTISTFCRLNLEKIINYDMLHGTVKSLYSVTFSFQFYWGGVSVISVFSSLKISLSALNWGKSSYVCIHLAGYASLLESQPWFHVNLTSDLKTRFLKVTANKQLQQENISVFYFSLNIRDYNFRLSEYDSHYNLKYVCITLFKKTKKWI